MVVLIALVNIAFILQASLVNGQGFTSCIYNSDCTADTNLGVIRLNGAVTGNPYQTTDPSNNVYYWKPCDDFTLAGVTAGAIQQTLGVYSTDIGKHEQAFCDVTFDGYIRFNMMSADYNKFTYVKCECGGDSTLKFDSESPYDNFNFIFSSKFCCQNYSPPTITITTAISPGAVLLIIFFSVVIFYFLFGTIFQVAIRKAEGRERVPNMSLWSALPGLIKDGFIFTFTCGRKTGYAKV